MESQRNRLLDEQAELIYSYLSTDVKTSAQISQYEKHTLSWIKLFQNSCDNNNWEFSLRVAMDVLFTTSFFFDGDCRNKEIQTSIHYIHRFISNLEWLNLTETILREKLDTNQIENILSSESDYAKKEKIRILKEINEQSGQFGDFQRKYLIMKLVEKCLKWSDYDEIIILEPQIKSFCTSEDLLNRTNTLFDQLHHIRENHITTIDSEFKIQFQSVMLDMVLTPSRNS